MKHAAYGGRVARVCTQRTVNLLADEYIVIEYVGTRSGYDNLEKILNTPLVNACDPRPLHVTGTSRNDDRQRYFVVGVQKM